MKISIFKTKKMKYLSNYFIYSVLTIVITILCYSNIGTVGYYLDDYSSIVNNPAIAPPTDLATIWSFSTMRFLAYSLLSFERGILFEPSFFHFVGLSIHIVCSLIIGLIIVQFLQLLDKDKGETELSISYKSYFFTSSLLFAVLPQNSQTVVYIVQQTTSLVSLFYLLTISFYLFSRASKNSRASKVYLFFSLLFFVGALFTKQNAFTLPFAILLIEWLFFGKWLKHLTLSYIFFGVIGAGYIFYLSNMDISNFLGKLDDLSRETSDINRLDYFRSQVGIIFHYITQFIYPNSLRLEYDWDVVRDWNIATVLFTCFHLVIVILAIIYRKKNTLLAFGVLFYYLAHSIESSFLPIKDIVFEHRTYLPNVGLVIACIALLNLFVKDKLRYLFLLFPVLIAGITVTKLRVDEWGNKEKFYLNEIKHSPKNARAYTALAAAFQDNGNCAKAIGYYSHAIALYRLSPKHDLGLQPETLQNYIVCLRQLRIDEKAEFFEQHLLGQVNEPIRRSQILLQRGIFFMKSEQFLKAEEPLTEAIKLNSKSFPIAINLVVTKVKLNKLKHAEPLLKHALALKPNDPLATDLLQQIQQLKN